MERNLTKLDKERKTEHLVAATKNRAFKRNCCHDEAEKWKSQNDMAQHFMHFRQMQSLKYSVQSRVIE